MTQESLKDQLFRKIDEFTLYGGREKKHKESIKKIISDYKKLNPNKNFNNYLRRNTEFGKNFTPLHVAVLRTSCELIQLFIDEGADPSIKIYDSWFSASNTGLTAYELCCICKIFNRNKIVKVIEPYTLTFNIKNKFYNTIKHSNVLKSITNCQYTNSVYLKIHDKIKLIFLIQNRFKIYLPNELWYKILETNYIKDY